MTTIAFLGAGTMGMPMARNLLDAGFSLRVWNRSSERARPLAEHGADVLSDPRAAAAGADVLITMLSDAEAVLASAEPALAGVPDGAVWIQMSTIGIDGTNRCEHLAGQRQVPLVDAPVLGTREPAQQGKLIILASGPDGTRDVCDPIFEAVGSRTMWLGDAGAATRCKVTINAWIVGVVGVLAETIALAESLGVDPGRFFEAIEGGPLDLPYARMKGAAMMKRSFDDPAFRLALSRKDGELILEAAGHCGLELPIIEAVTERLRRAERDGHGDEDMAATYWATPPRIPAFAPRDGG